MANTAPLWLDTTTFPGSSTYPGHGSTGDPIYPDATLYPGASTYPGQGTRAVHQLLMSFNDAQEQNPTWYDVTDRMRSFQITRGRNSELQEMDAGTESLVLDNRDRALDPTFADSPYWPNVGPMNRVWHRVQFAGETNDQFRGYVDGIDQQWPGKVDAVAIITATDESKVLALDALPTTTPPRDSYDQVVMADNPAAYWRMSDASTTMAQAAAVGPKLSSVVTAGGGMRSLANGAIVGDNPNPSSAMGLDASWSLSTGDLALGDAPDMSGQAEFTAETWFQTDAFPAGTDTLMCGPSGGGGPRQWTLYLTSAGAITFEAQDATPTAISVSSTPISTGQWHHLVGVISGASLALYVDGVQAASTAWSGVVQSNGLGTGVSDFSIGPGTVTSVYFDETAIYRYGLAADRILAHYEAGTQRGFARLQLPHERVIAALDMVQNRAPRTLSVGTRQMTGTYTTGQAPIVETREAARAEAVDAVLFVARTGAIVFLDAAHRGSAPYSSPRATFGDGGGAELPYQDIDIEYSDSFLANEWNVTRDGGTTTYTRSDDTSIARHFKRSQSITGLKITSDVEAAAIADAMLDKYREPFTRVTSLEPKMSDASVAEEVFRMDLADRIRVLRTPPGGGDRLDQQLFIQRIEISGDQSSPYTKVRLGVSPV